MEEECLQSEKQNTIRSAVSKKTLTTRLHRIEGQLRGVERMVENDACCYDILIQASAVIAALKGFERELLETHIRECVTSELKAGNDGVIDELMATMERMIR